MKRRVVLRIRSTIAAEIEDDTIEGLTAKADQRQKELEVAVTKLPGAILSKAVRRLRMEEPGDGRWVTIEGEEPTEQGDE